jgi:hypothetical protein
VRCRAYLWSTLIPLWLLTLTGCNAACAAYDIHKAYRRSHPNSSEIPNSSPAPEPQKASILLKVYPQVAHAPAEVRVTVLVKDPGLTLRCPSLAIDFGDGCTSETEESCKPGEEYRLGYAWPLPNHPYRSGGALTVTLTVRVDGKPVMAESVPLLMLDPPGEDESSKLASR